MPAFDAITCWTHPYGPILTLGYGKPWLSYRGYRTVAVADDDVAPHIAAADCGSAYCIFGAACK
jgi:hypothetical protein